MLVTRQEAEVALKQMLAALNLDYSLWKNPFPRTEESALVFSDLSQMYPPFETLARCPCYGNMLSAIFELFTGYKIVWRLSEIEVDGVKVVKVTGLRLEDSERSQIIRQQSPIDVESHDDDFDDDSDQETLDDADEEDLDDD